jgi:hypothetical protein
VVPEDRVRVSAGPSQVYGTQFMVTEERLEPAPISEPGRLGERRAAVGLEPLAAYDARIPTG